MLFACAYGKGLNGWVSSNICRCLYSVVVAAAAVVVNGGGVGAKCCCWIRSHNYHLWGWPVVNGAEVGGKCQ